MASIVHEDGSGNVLASYSYTYYANGWLKSETDWQATTDGSTPTTVTTSYTYDGAGELIQAGSQTYAYDLNGNPSGSNYQIGPDNDCCRTAPILTATTPQATRSARSTRRWQQLDLHYDTINQMTSAVEKAPRAIS